MRIRLGLLGALLLLSLMGMAATNNSGNPPTFLWLDICTNGIGDQSGGEYFPRMEADVFDIGVDLGADGTVDRWLSQEWAKFVGRENADSHISFSVAPFLHPFGRRCGQDR